MSISIKIHSTDTTAQTCVVTVKDSDTVVINKKNIGLELNPDGTANTDYIIYMSKLRVKQTRFANTENSIMVSSHPQIITQ